MVALLGDGASVKSGRVPSSTTLPAFLDGSLLKISGRGELAGAIRYGRSRWTALTRYLDDGRLEISNNAAERAIRPNHQACWSG
jgi:transposase